MNWEQILPPAITGLGTLIVAWFGFRNRTLEAKEKAESEERAAVRHEIARLREDLESRDKEARDNHKHILALRLEVSQLQVGVLTLLTQLHAAGMTPHWQPPIDWMPFHDLIKREPEESEV